MRNASRASTTIASITLALAAALGAALGGSIAFAQDEPGSAGTDDDADIPFALPSSGPFEPADIEIENSRAIADWFRSGHADAAAEAFRHWDADEEIQPACADLPFGRGLPRVPRPGRQRARGRSRGRSIPAAWSIAAPATTRASPKSSE